MFAAKQQIPGKYAIGSENGPAPRLQVRASFLAHADSWLKTKKPAELPIRGGPGMQPSHDGSDEQIFGAKQQVMRRGPGDDLPMNGGSIKGLPALSSCYPRTLHGPERGLSDMFNDLTRLLHGL